MAAARSSASCSSSTANFIREARLTSPEVVAREVRPFSDRAVRLALSLASQAAVAYENGRLYQDIEKLFEGFVQASVKAIEQRDPTTSGHSLRVSQMTVGLAEIVDRVDTGSYASIRFSPEQMKEIRYAALLHDFGKVGVREDVLVKAKKLYPMQMDLIAHRFDYLYMEMEAQLEREKVRLLLEMDRPEALARIASLEEEYRLRRAQVESGFEAILQANEPTVLPEGEFDRLFEIARQTYHDPRGVERPILTAGRSPLSFHSEGKPQRGRARPDRIPRRSQLQFPASNSVDQANPRDSADRSRAPREIKRHGLSLQIAER